MKLCSALHAYTFQEPILFSGTMRKNLDPFSDYDDMELWNALDEVCEVN